MPKLASQAHATTLISLTPTLTRFHSSRYSISTSVSSKNSLKTIKLVISGLPLQKLINSTIIPNFSSSVLVLCNFYYSNRSKSKAI